MTEQREKIVRVIAVDQRYMNNPYPAIPVYDSAKNCYLTGQHIDPSIPATKNRLTVDEMLGKKMLSDEKAIKYPFIINPETGVKIMHMERLNITGGEEGSPVNAAEWAKYCFLVGYCSFIAFSKKEVIAEKTYFYMEDLEKEAAEEIEEIDLIFEAQKCIREKTSIRGWREVGMMLNYKIQNFSVNVDTLSDVRLKKELLDACEEHPEEVISCFKEDAKEDLQVFKLVRYGILENKNGAYYEGNTIVGTSLDTLKLYMKSNNPENQKFVSKWFKLLLEKEGRISKGIEKKVQSNTETSEVELKDKAINDMSFEEMKDYAGKIKKYPGTDWKELDEEKLRSYLLGKKVK